MDFVFKYIPLLPKGGGGGGGGGREEGYILTDKIHYY